MRTEARSPWPFLLSRLRQASRTTISAAELEAAGLDAGGLLAAHVIERAPIEAWRAPGCEHVCTPALDFETRRKERLVGVACPYDPACWPGVRWYPAGIAETFSCSAETIFAALRTPNGLAPLAMPSNNGVQPVGLLARRGMNLPVVWIRDLLASFDEVCLGLRQKLGGDGLVVLPSRGAGKPSMPADRIVVLDLAGDGAGDLRLWRALDLLDPTYRERRVTDPAAIFDDVRFEFAEEPGVRHVVKINGVVYGGFQKSDLKFARLLLLAAARKSNPDVEGGGWLQKFKLQGDEKDHDLEDVRKELRRYDHPVVSCDDRAALVKRARGRSGTVRLAVPPTNITFDPSLAAFQFIGEQQSQTRTAKRRPTPGQKQRAENFARSNKVANKLLDDARKLGVPGPA